MFLFVFQAGALPPPSNATAAGCPRGGWSLGSNDAFVAFTGAGCYFGPRARLLRENAFPDWTSTATGLPRDAVIKQGTTLNAFGSHGLFVFALPVGSFAEHAPRPGNIEIELRCMLQPCGHAISWSLMR